MLQAEEASKNCATEAGLAAPAFDAAHQGASEGEPRFLNAWVLRGVDQIAQPNSFDGTSHFDLHGEDECVSPPSPSSPRSSVSTRPGTRFKTERPESPHTC
ncbi:hypothetical protein ACFYRY_06240 [Streptomyces sp. NPDC005263]|uniref:hypothetical protein n=1 Tax=Streptomyces sp. NPDC005263 TaxID=3364711 RepID=UPI0036B65421